MLVTLGVLEASWLDAYVHASHLNDYGEVVVKKLFDECDRARLIEPKPLRLPASLERTTLFRGCAGPMHTLGMSRTPSLDKAIWYAAKHAAYHELDTLAVYATTVDVSEIYCRLDHYDDDFIVRPREAWRVDVPVNESS